MERSKTFVNEFAADILSHVVRDKRVMVPVHDMLADAFLVSLKVAVRDGWNSVREGLQAAAPYVYVGILTCAMGLLGYQILKKPKPKPEFFKRMKKQIKDGQLVERERFESKISTLESVFRE